jgi:hypothetical protein
MFSGDLKVNISLFAGLVTLAITVYLFHERQLKHHILGTASTPSHPLEQKMVLPVAAPNTMFSTVEAPPTIDVE